MTRNLKIVEKFTIAISRNKAIFGIVLFVVLVFSSIYNVL